MKFYLYDEPIDLNKKNNLFITIASYMDDDIREDLHGDLAPCSNTEFLEAYIHNDPGFTELLESEFSIYVQEEE